VTEGVLAPGAHVSFVLSVVPRGPVQAGEKIGVRVEAAGTRVDSQLVAIDRGIAGLARALAPGEPLAVELSVELPRATAPLYQVSIGVTQAAAGAKRGRQTPPIFTPIGELPAGAALAAPERSLPRYPSSLPTALDAELVRLRPAVTRAIEQSRRSGQPPADVALSRELTAHGERLEQSGDGEQAYLAYVWATQVRRRAWEELADALFRLRRLALGDEHPLELALLQRYYASGGARELERLAAFYLSLGRLLESEYFLRRLPEAQPDGDLVGALREALAALSQAARTGAVVPPRALLERVALDPLGGALDFEADELTGWEGQADAFRAGAPRDRHGIPGLRGVHGGGVLSSRNGGDGARGALTSPEFRLDGALLSVLVGGGSRQRRVGVELLVDGAVAFSAAGNDSDNLLPVFWDIAALAGKAARLRVFDESKRDHVVIDRVMIWR
jgi:hypothetical protein